MVVLSTMRFSKICIVNCLFYQVKCVVIQTENIFMLQLLWTNSIKYLDVPSE